jgi:hypothetical protein
MSNTLSRLLIALSFVMTLAGASPAAAQQRIPAQVEPEPDSDGSYCSDDERCGTVRLPDGLVLLGGCRLIAKRGNVEADVADLDTSGGEIGTCGALRAVVLEENGTLVVETTWGLEVSLSRAHIDARLELAAATRLQKKRPRAAEQTLERALALDPGLEEAAFALARVRLALGEPDRAADALAPFVARQPLRLYAKVLTDRKLHPLANQAPFVAVRARQPGTATITGTTSTMIAFAAERKLFAVVQRREHRWHPRFEISLVVFDAAGVHADVPLVESSKEGDPDEANPVVPRKRLELANRFLADFGFVAVADAERVAFQKTPSGSQAAPFLKAGLGIAFRDGFVRLLRGDQVLQELQIHEPCPESGPTSDDCDYPPRFAWAAWIPALDTVLLEWAEGGEYHTDIWTAIKAWPVTLPDRSASTPELP